MEQWKAVKGYEGIYEVSNAGKVRTAEGKVTYSERYGKRIWKQRELKQVERSSNSGYRTVTLYRDKEKKQHSVHRLVAEAFLEKIPGKEIVNHKDGDKSNNHASNLEWATYQENLYHAYETGLNQVRKKIALIEKETGKVFEFQSMSAASKFLGKTSPYIRQMISVGRFDLGEYKIKQY